MDVIIEGSRTEGRAAKKGQGDPGSRSKPIDKAVPRAYFLGPGNGMKVELLCMKYNQLVDTDKDPCPHPSDYCKYRNSCVINRLCTERKMQTLQSYLLVSFLRPRAMALFLPDLIITRDNAA
jgi:hypothetical protein